MLVFLIGMMGCGKTTLGRQLAGRLGYAFVDLDAFIEQREGRSVAQLFEQEGQERFRVLERKALEEAVLLHEQAVISTGGGAPCFFGNMQFINSHGKSFFLDVPVEELVARLSKAELNARPLLKNKTPEELNSFLSKTLADRRRFYEQAHHVISLPPFTAAAIQALLNHT